MSHLDQQILHSFEIQLMLFILSAEQRIDISPILAGTGVSVNDLNEPAFRLTTEQELVIYTRIAKANRSASLGLRVGCKLSLANYGILGFSMMCAKTLGEAVRSIAQFSPLISWASSNTLTRVNDGDYDGYLLTIEPTVQHEQAIELEASSTFASLNRVLNDIASVPFSYQHIYLKHRASEEELRAYRQHFECAVTDNHDTYSAFIDNEIFEHKLPHAQPHYGALIKDLCKQEMANFNRGNIVDLIKRYIVNTDVQSLTMQSAADHVNLSTRQLRRRLADHHQSFQQLLDAHRTTQAKQYLSTTHLSVEAIGQQLGFSDARSFRAFFKRNTSLTPAQFRQSV